MPIFHDILLLLSISHSHIKFGMKDHLHTFEYFPKGPGSRGSLTRVLANGPT